MAFVVGFFLKKFWPQPTPIRNGVVGEGEMNPEWQQVPSNNPPLEGRGIAVQAPLPGAGGALDESIHSLVQQVRPAVLKVIVMPSKNADAAASGIKMGDAFPLTPDQAVGSGVIIDPQGLFLTTKHVVGDGNDLQVSLYRAGQTQFTARVIARDPDSPLVIGKIRAAAGQQFPFVRMGDSNRLRTGDGVMVLGNPFSLSGTVTSGIVSGKRDVTVEGMAVRDAILTDATINKGNAGGPLVNLDGEVVGIAFASYVQGDSFTGIGFAVPINFAKEAWGAVP
ncbi:MAG: trypsin-like peptidase domain-containing protein [Deltaproteobacteria bacterium]|nr:trypsin-like peptidase domain-containing protein [Deltaproteobacteria bacterium]